MEVSPANLYLSIRGIQYAFNEAISDLVDNSIDADASTVWIKADKNKIIIADDGNGMNLEELQEAVTPWKAGKRDPKKRRGKRGKFGIGLKSASYSLGECLDIHTQKKGNTFEHIELDKDKLYTIDDIGHIFNTDNKPTELFKSYCKHSHGTVLEISKVNTRKVTDQALESLKNLLGLTYFSLIERGEVTILVNNQEVRGLDPLMRGLKKNDNKNKYVIFDKQTINVSHEGRSATFKIQGAYVGRGNFWTEDDKKSYRYFLKRNPKEGDETKTGLLKLDEQGLYIIRNGRLITLGGWHGLASQNTLLHHNTSTRLLLEFDEAGDEMMGLDNTKTLLKIEETLKDKLGNYVREVVNAGEKEFRREAKVIEKARQKAKASQDVKEKNLKKESAFATYQLDERRKKANPDFDKKQKDIEDSQKAEATSSEHLIELKESLPYNNLWSWEKNKEGEILLLFNEEHPGYTALFIEDDESVIKKNLNYFFYTIALHEAAIQDLHSDLKPAAREELEKAFKTFRRWVSKHYTEF